MMSGESKRDVVADGRGNSAHGVWFEHEASSPDYNFPDQLGLQLLRRWPWLGGA